MASEDGSEASSPLEDVPDDSRRELIRWVAAADRDANREIYDALKHE